MKDGSTTLFLLADAPLITYTSNFLIVKSDTKRAAFDVVDILNVTLEDNSIPTSIDRVSFGSDGLLFRQLPAGSTVRVFTADGKSVCTKTADSDGGLILNFSELPKGVLIIHTPTTTIKVNN